MKLLEKILLATDFKASFAPAMAVANFVAQKFNSEIILMHVIPEQLQIPPNDLVRKLISEEMHKLKNHLAQQGAKVPKLVLENGSAFDKIIQQADLDGANVIIAGAGDRNNAGKHVLGLTAEKLARKSNKPVWLVKSDAQLPIRNIVCAADFSSASQRALKNAIQLARRFQAKLVVLHVAESLAGFYRFFSKKDPKEPAERMQACQAQFDEFVRAIDFLDVPWSREIRAGKVVEEIAGFCQERNCDLLLMGTLGTTNNPHSMIGATAQSLLREMPCSVLTVKSENAIQVRLNFEIADIENHFKAGQELLTNGFPEEALHHFQHCVNEDILYAPSWEGLAAAHERLGNTEEAAFCRAQAAEIRQRLWQKQVEMEIRHQHDLFGKARKDF